MNSKDSEELIVAPDMDCLEAGSPKKHAGLLSDEDIEKSLEEYGENIDAVSEEFKRRTKVQDADVAFLFLATALQVARINLVNYFMEIELAGDNKLERFAHDKQEKALARYKENRIDGITFLGRDLPSARELAQTRGVPYDITPRKELGIKLFKGLGRGAHRFATLGHDPILGFIFGTADIATDSITCVTRQGVPVMGVHVPVSFQVLYDVNRKNPSFGGSVPTPLVLSGAATNIAHNPAVLAISVIKQMLHIVSDMRTPCGIQLPAANLLLGSVAADKLTKYISTGDLTVGVMQASLTVLINGIIEAAHGCTLLFQEGNEDYDIELLQVRTKKIVDLSNLIASSSNVIETVVRKDLKRFDIGGLAITLSRLFNDTLFINKLKYEYLNSEVSKIYESRAVGLLDPAVIEKMSADYVFESPGDNG